MSTLSKICPRCAADHQKAGIFCSRACANVRVHSQEVRNRIAAGNLGKKRNRTVSQERLNEIQAKVAATKLAKLLATPIDELSRHQLKRLISYEQDHKCLCGINTWLGKPLVLELDHIDGNHDNNAYGNLRLLCPNCHSQTPTWRRAKAHPLWAKQQPQSEAA